MATERLTPRMHPPHLLAALAAHELTRFFLSGGYPSVLIDDIHHYIVTDDCHPSRGICKHMFNNQLAQLNVPSAPRRDSHSSNESLSGQYIGHAEPDCVPHYGTQATYVSPASSLI